jgi:hypothetical protein
MVGNDVINAAVRCVAVRATGSRLPDCTHTVRRGTSPAAYLFDIRGLQSDHLAIRAQIPPEELHAAGALSPVGSACPAHLRCAALTVWSATV